MKSTNPFIDLLHMSKELEKMNKKQEGEMFELEVEVSGMIYRMDMKHLETFMLKLNEIGKKLEGDK